MPLHIIVPVKPLAEAKSRLASVLEAAERQALARRLLQGVLAVVQQAQQRLPAIGLVISADPQVLELAVEHGLTALLESLDKLGTHQQPGSDSRITDHGSRLTPHEAALNAALEQATSFARDQGAGAVLVLPADLPLLTLAEVEKLWQASQQLYSARAMVIAPDGRNEGTNALLVRPPGALRYQFGPDSFRRHCRQAQALGMAWHVQRSTRLGLDVDVPADLDDLAAFLAVENADMPGKAQRGKPTMPLFNPNLESFLEQPNLLMRLGTIGRDGFPQVTPVWYLFEDGLFYVTTAGDRVKTHNMLATPKVGFAIDSDVKPYRGVSVWGMARLLAEGEAARPLTRRIAARYVPAERLDAMVETLMQAPRVVFAIEPLRAVPMGSWG